MFPQPVEKMIVKDNTLDRGGIMGDIAQIFLKKCLTMRCLCVIIYLACLEQRLF